MVSPGFGEQRNYFFPQITRRAQPDALNLRAQEIEADVAFQCRAVRTVILDGRPGGDRRKVRRHREHLRGVQPGVMPVIRLPGRGPYQPASGVESGCELSDTERGYLEPAEHLTELTAVCHSGHREVERSLA